MRALDTIATALVLFACQTLGQTATATAPTTTNAPTTSVESEPEKSWSFGANVFTYIVPDSREYVQPTFTADRGRLHLEARYNYEGLNTGSAWIGCNFSVGEKLSLDFTPMLGGVFGETTGVAPGYECTLSWWKLELYSEGEYVLDVGASSDSFFYTWTELTLAPVDWFRFGLVMQRTKLYQTEFDIQRGLLLGLSVKQLDFTACVFDPGASQVTVVLGVGLNF